ncbi:hypothetical protein Hanom_Chr11g00972651 [Helianthus anomalus]
MIEIQNLNTSQYKYLTNNQFQIQKHYHTLNVGLGNIASPDLETVGATYVFRPSTPTYKDFFASCIQ